MKKLLLSILFFVLFSIPVLSDGSTKINIHDNTNNGLDPENDPVIGFVVYNQPAAGDYLIIEVSLKKAVANAELEVQLVQVGTSLDNGGIPDEPGSHSGHVNVLGTITTNNQGNGNAHFRIDLNDLPKNPTGPWDLVPGEINYGHIDIEDDSGAKDPAIENYGLVAEQIGARVVAWMQPLDPDDDILSLEEEQANGNGGQGGGQGNGNGGQGGGQGNGNGGQGGGQGKGNGGQGGGQGKGNGGQGGGQGKSKGKGKH